MTRSERAWRRAAGKRSDGWWRFRIVVGQLGFTVSVAAEFSFGSRLLL